MSIDPIAEQRRAVRVEADAKGSDPCSIDRRHNVTAWYQLLVVGCVLAIVASAAGASRDDESAIRDILLARFARLHNLMARYTTTSHFKLPPGMDIDDAYVELEHATEWFYVGTMVMTGEFSVLGDSFFYSYTEQSFDCKIKNPAFYRMRRTDRQTDIITPTRVETLFGRTLDGQTEYSGHILAERVELPSYYVATILGLDIAELRHPFTEDDIKQMKIDRSADGQVLLQHVRDGEFISEWTIDPNRGHAITRCCKRWSRGKDRTEWVMDDFREVGGLLLPYKAHETRWWGDGSKGTEVIVDVHEYRLDDPANTPERYRMRWPEGIFVIDHRSGMRFVAGAEDLGDDDPQTTAEAREAPAPADSNAVTPADRQRRADANEPQPPPGLAAPPGSKRWPWLIAAIAILALAGVLRYRFRTLGP